MTASKPNAAQRKVQARYPSATLMWSEYYQGWAIYRDDEGGERLSNIVGKGEAWENAARRMKEKKP